jgi:thymidylate kinase
VTATLVTITGPIASGKNTVAVTLADRCAEDRRTVLVADVDDVAAMVAGPGPLGGLWFAAHQAHGALVAQWLLTGVEVVISVGRVYTEAEQDALYGRLPANVRSVRVLIDAPLAVTWERARSDENRRLSRERDFHIAARARFRSLMAGIPADLVFDSADMTAAAIAAVIYEAVGSSGSGSAG